MPIDFETRMDRYARDPNPENREALIAAMQECEWCGHSNCGCESGKDPWQPWRCDCPHSDAEVEAMPEADVVYIDRHLPRGTGDPRPRYGQPS